VSVVEFLGTTGPSQCGGRRLGLKPRTSCVCRRSGVHASLL